MIRKIKSGDKNLHLLQFRFPIELHLNLFPRVRETKADNAIILSGREVTRQRRGQRRRLPEEIMKENYESRRR